MTEFIEGWFTDMHAANAEIASLRAELAREQSGYVAEHEECERLRAELASERAANTANIAYAKNLGDAMDDLCAAYDGLRGELVQAGAAARQDAEETARLREALERISMLYPDFDAGVIARAALACRPQAPRCDVTGNPCGTDTWPIGLQCGCKNCQSMARLSSPGGRSHEMLRWL